MREPRWSKLCVAAEGQLQAGQHVWQMPVLRAMRSTPGRANAAVRRSAGTVRVRPVEGGDQGCSSGRGGPQVRVRRGARAETPILFNVRKDESTVRRQGPQARRTREAGKLPCHALRQNQVNGINGFRARFVRRGTLVLGYEEA